MCSKCSVTAAKGQFVNWVREMYMILLLLVGVAAAVESGHPTGPAWKPANLSAHDGIFMGTTPSAAGVRATIRIGDVPEGTTAGAFRG